MLHVAQARQEELTAAAAQSSQAAQRAAVEVEAISEECENLKMELASRPTLKQWHAAKAEVSERGIKCGRVCIYDCCKIKEMEK